MYEIIAYVLGIGLLLCLFRLARGPTLPDRVIAFDSASSIIVALIVVLSLEYGNSYLIDIALVYAILGFISTLAISKFLIGEHMGD